MEDEPSNQFIIETNTKDIEVSKIKDVFDDERRLKALSPEAIESFPSPDGNPIAMNGTEEPQKSNMENPKDLIRVVELKGFIIKQKRLHLKQFKMSYHFHPSTLKDLGVFHEFLNACNDWNQIKEYVHTDPFKLLIAKLVIESNLDPHPLASSILDILLPKCLTLVYPWHVKDSSSDINSRNDSDKRCPSLGGHAAYNRNNWISLIYSAITDIAEYTNYGLSGETIQRSIENFANSNEMISSTQLQLPIIPCYVWELKNNIDVFSNSSLGLFLEERKNFRRDARVELYNYIQGCDEAQLLELFGTLKKRKNTSFQTTDPLSPLHEKNRVGKKAKLNLMTNKELVVSNEVKDVPIDLTSDHVEISIDKENVASTEVFNPSPMTKKKANEGKRKKAIALSQCPIDSSAPNKGRLSNFFTILKRESVSKTENTNNGYHEFFKPFFIKPNVTLAPVHPPSKGIHSNKAHGSTIKSYISSLSYTPPKAAVSWRSTCMKIIEGLQKHNNKLEEIRKGSFIPIIRSRRKNLTILEDEEQTSPSDLVEAEDELPIVKFKLLQFHDNIRPAYFGSFSKCSLKINPRRPFAKDSDALDYSIDSDEEWEDDIELEEVESLESDDQDDEGEGEEEDIIDSDNDWLVPHGYLSEDEGIDQIKSHLDQGEEDEEEDPITLRDRKLKSKEIIKESSNLANISTKKPFKILTSKVIGPVYQESVQNTMAHELKYSLYEIEKLKTYKVFWTYELLNIQSQLNAIDPFQVIFGVPALKNTTSQNLLCQENSFTETLAALPLFAFKQEGSMGPNDQKERKRKRKESIKEKTMVKGQQMAIESPIQQKEDELTCETVENYCPLPIPPSVIIVSKASKHSNEESTPTEKKQNTMASTPVVSVKGFLDEWYIPFIKLVHGSPFSIDKLWKEFRERIGLVSRRHFEFKLMEYAIKEKRPSIQKGVTWYIKDNYLKAFELTDLSPIKPDEASLQDLEDVSGLVPVLNTTMTPTHI